MLSACFASFVASADQYGEFIMKKLLATLLVSSSLIAPLAMSDTAEARAIEIQTQLKKYPGPAAYMAVYLTK
ncbi:MAG TPA: hypothetical protein DCS30_14830, partial [Rhizobiales bacterium]|nr:hypothetical protein [Hyphomicrobiales bacterium]